MTYVLDTNVISELRRRNADQRVRTWVDRQPASALMISVVTVIEIETGILRLARTDSAQARILRTWFNDRVLAAFADRILPIDLEAARHVAPLHVPHPAPRHDALIAGTALAHRLIVVTRNTQDFERTGIEAFNPWTDPVRG